MLYSPNISFRADAEHFAVHMIGAGASLISPKHGDGFLTGESCDDWPMCSVRMYVV